MKVKPKLIRMSSLYSGLGLFIFFIIMQLTYWLPLRFWGISGFGNFIDTQQVLRWSECYITKGDLIFQNHGECAGYIYGSTLIRILSFLDITQSSTLLFGYFFMLILAITISSQAGMIDKFRTNPYLLAIVLSPPVLLLAERANLDILILGLIALTGLLFIQGYHTWALFPLSLATLFKFYTLPIFAILFLFNDNKRKIFTSTIGLMVSLRVFLDLQLIQSSFPGGAGAKFGVSIWAPKISEVFDSDLGKLLANLSGVIVLTLISVTTLIVLKKTGISISSQFVGNNPTRIYFYLFFGVHLSCYLSGASYDYRLIFLVIASIIYLDSLSSKSESLYNVVLVMTLLSLWLTYPSSGLAPIGDLTTGALTFILTIRLIQLIKLDLRVKFAK